jgi:hypothetical protein
MEAVVVAAWHKASEVRWIQVLYLALLVLTILTGRPVLASPFSLIWVASYTAMNSAGLYCMCAAACGCDARQSCLCGR